MDSEEVSAAVARLLKGKPVDVYFDVGEDKSANAFVRKVAPFGLIAELHDDAKVSWSGSPTRPWFIKAMLGSLIVFLVGFWFFLTRPPSVLGKAAGIIFGVWLLSPFIVAGIREGKISEEQTQWNRKLELGVRLGLPLLAGLIAGIVSEPWIGVALVALVPAGVLCAVIIRTINRRD
ncbi:MAG: hypothetical protein HY651_07185 [Acidobacteria bacterium]|nr:hypothetical protein [Acidobacteriota bacterium]